jgi:hypothetical protein
MAYLPPLQPTESDKHFRQRISAVLLAMEENANPRPEMRIVRHHPHLPWPNVWKNRILQDYLMTVSQYGMR